MNQNQRQNPTSQPSELTKIQNIIENNFDESQQKLSLYNCAKYWRDVMLSRDWSTLRILSLYHCQIDENGAEMLGNMEWPNLTALRIGYNKIPAAGVQKILTHKLCQLNQLNLHNNHIGDDGIYFLMKFPFISQLIILNIEKIGITGLGLTSMLSTNLNQLLLLQLAKNCIGSEGIKLLIKSELPLIQQLGLSECGIGSSGFKQLSKGNWPRLSILWLYRNSIKFDGCDALRNNNWNQLGVINICEKEDQIGLISHFSMISTPWRRLKIFNEFEGPTSMREDMEKIIADRFLE